MQWEHGTQFGRTHQRHHYANPHRKCSKICGRARPERPWPCEPPERGGNGWLAVACGRPPILRNGPQRQIYREKEGRRKERDFRNDFGHAHEARRRLGPQAHWPATPSQEEPFPTVAENSNQDWLVLFSCCFILLLFRAITMTVMSTFQKKIKTQFL